MPGLRDLRRQRNELSEAEELGTKRRWDTEAVRKCGREICGKDPGGDRERGGGCDDVW